MDLKTEIEKYYKIFKGLPNHKPIVRQNQTNDAFEIVVYNLLFRENKFSPLTKNDIEELSSYIISPPDDSIDIFFEEISGDDFVYHIVQVKNSELDEANIKSCFASMHRTIDNYIDNRKKVSVNARNIISKTNFDEITKTNVKFYVVHSGTISSIKDLKENEKIINLDEIETLLKSIKEFSVPYHKFKIKDKTEYLEYKNPQKERKSIICTIKASELAELTERYINTDIGRNILFGQNLREALSKGSKTYEGIKDTIMKEPENFWYYNNGITIVSRKLDFNNKEIILKNFSIINGAQTSNSFVLYKEDIIRDFSGNEKIELLKKLSKVSVLARIVETAEDKNFKNKITLFNNTQNPISPKFRRFVFLDYFFKKIFTNLMLNPIKSHFIFKKTLLKNIFTLNFFSFLFFLSLWAYFFKTIKQIVQINSTTFKRYSIYSLGFKMYISKNSQLFLS